MNIKKMKGVASDMSSAALEIGAETIADNLPALAKCLGDAGLVGSASILANGVLGAIVPGALGLAMTYRAKRTERNVGLLIDNLSRGIDEINRRMDALEEVQAHKFISGIYRDALLDAIVDEKEASKVQGCINAFLNLMSSDENSDSFVLALFDDLTRLTTLDLRVLRLHGSSHILGYEIDDDAMSLMADENIDDSQYRSIREKLCRFGLLQSGNEEKQERNLLAVQDCLTALIKQLSSTKGGKLPKAPKIQKLSTSDTYKITRLGIRYLQLLKPLDSDVEQSS